MLDQSMDCSLEQCLVVYATYLDTKGLGQPISQFMKFENEPNKNEKTIYGIVYRLINDRDFLCKNLIHLLLQMQHK